MTSRGRPVDVVHVITGLRRGGAELVLARLLRATLDGVPRQAVVTLTAGGSVRSDIEACGVPVRTLGMLGVRQLPSAIGDLRSLLEETRPQVVQTWMYHADLLGGIAGRRAQVPRVVWGLHQGDLHPETTKRATMAVVSLNARLSKRVPHAIVACSDAARDTHVGVGYASDKIRVIPNGFDDRSPHPGGSRGARKELDLPSGDLLVGLVGRLHPHKGHRVFLEAARLVADRCRTVRFLLCGAGTDGPQVRRWVRDLNLASRVHLLGERRDVDVVYEALDLLCSASVGEGFPGVVGEAMIHGLPVIATHVGDTATLLGGAGRLIPARSPLAMAEAIVEFLDLDGAERNRLGALGRRRVLDRFGSDLMASRYIEVWSGS